MPVTGAKSRAGLSLTELVVVIALLGLTGAAMSSTIVRQQRFHRHASAMLGARQGIRDAMEVLSADIRGSSASDTIRLMADSALELFTTIGISVACRPASGSAIPLAAESPTGNTLSSFLLTPDTGDVALVLRPVSEQGEARWERHQVAAIGATSNGRACLVDGGPTEGFHLTMRDPPVSAVEPGTPVRFLRRARYSLYRTSDGSWYLGYRRCDALGPSVCGGIQPVSGPYRRYSPDESQTGFLFEYFNSEGDRLAPGDSPLSVARVDVTARSENPRRSFAPASGESLAAATVSIALRNR